MLVRGLLCFLGLVSDSWLLMSLAKFVSCRTVGLKHAPGTLYSQLPDRAGPEVWMRESQASLTSAVVAHESRRRFMQRK